MVASNVDGFRGSRNLNMELDGNRGRLLGHSSDDASRPMGHSLHNAAGMPGRLSWATLGDLYAQELAEHWRRAEALGLDCPEDVFEQLFHEYHDDSRLAELMRLSGLVRLIFIGSVRRSNVAAAAGRQYAPAAPDQCFWAAPQLVL